MSDTKSRQSGASDQPAEEVQGSLSFGTVIKPHGLKGLLKVKPHRTDTDALLEARSVWLEVRGRRTRHQVRSVRRDRLWFLLELEGCRTRDAGEAWRGAEVSIPRDDLPPLEEDEIYLADCIGLDAVTPDGVLLGSIQGIIETAGHDLFEIIDRKSELLVPACAPFLVDVTSDQVILQQVEDLPRRPLDENRPQESRRGRSGGKKTRPESPRDLEPENPESKAGEPGNKNPGKGR